MPSLISREDAAAKGQTTYYTGMPCRKAGHISERYVSNGACLMCLQRFRRVTQNPWTKELTPFLLDTGFYVPTGLTPELHGELVEFLHQCVEHWVGQKGLTTPSIQNAYQQATMHRLQRAQVKK